MTPRSLAALLAISIAPAAFAQAGVGRTLDEGVFIVMKSGAPSQTESFKIVQMDNGQIRATGQVLNADSRISSVLLADSLGTPASYAFISKAAGATTLDVRAQPRGRRLTVSSSDNHNNESMKELPIDPGGTVILDEGLVHQLYFVAMGKRAGSVEVIEPRTARHNAYALTGKGLETVQIGRRSVTATHYSLTGGPQPRDFWVDTAGRLLKVELPGSGIVAVRDELPK